MCEGDAMLTRRALFGGLAVLALAGCAPTTKANILTSGAKLRQLSAETPEVPAIADTMRAFGWQLALADEGTNRLISPSSFALALGMLAEGASGDTAAAIDKVFGITGDQRSAALGGWKQTLAKYDRLPEKLDLNEPPHDPLAHLAAQVVVVEHTVEQAFVDRLASYYAAPAVSVRSWRDLEPVLDEFAKRETAGLIEKSGIAPDSNTLLVLQDSVLFAAAWMPHFTRGNMQFNAPGSRMQVDSFNGSFIAHAVAAANARAVRVPCNERFAVDVIVPDTAPDTYTPEQLQAVTTALAASPEVDVILEMPSSQQSSNLDFAETLSRQGIKPGSYDGIFPGAQLDAFVQQAKLIISDQGVIGAALTEAGVAVAAPLQPGEPFELTVDRPYILQVVDEQYGWPLFLALITDPTQQ